MDGRQTREAFQVLKKLAKSSGKRATGALTLSDGSITRDKEALRSTWTTHWSNHFKSVMEGGHGFSNVELRDYSDPFQQQFGVEQSLDAPAFGPTTPLESPDRCPRKYWESMEPILSTALAQEYNTCLSLARIPDAWSGSFVIPIHKAGKAPCETSSYRPIQLMLAEAKVFSRLMLMHIAQCVAISWRKYAQSTGCSAPLTVCHQVTAYAQHKNKSVALLFIDVAAAFDEVSHQLLLGTTEVNDTMEADIGSSAPLVHAGLRKNGVTCEEARSIQMYVREYPHHILTGALPPKLLRLVHEWVTSPWMKIRGGIDDVDDTTSPALRMSCGIKQGDCLSGFMFCAFFDVLLLQLHRFILDNTEVTDFDTARTTNGDNVASVLAFADDVLLPMTNDCPRKLLTQ
eukprot:3512108-Amphidinium_carterae.1